jgi:hypothetical protein
MPNAILLRRPLVDELLETLATFTVADWRALNAAGHDRDDAYLDALHRAHTAEDLVDDAVRECIAHADTRIDALWRAVEGAARHPTPTDLTGDFPWIMARGAARALLLRPVAGLGAEGFRLLHEPVRPRRRRRRPPPARLDAR